MHFPRLQEAHSQFNQLCATCAHIECSRLCPSMDTCPRLQWQAAKGLLTFGYTTKQYDTYLHSMQPVSKCSRSNTTSSIAKH